MYYASNANVQKYMYINIDRKIRVYKAMDQYDSGIHSYASNKSNLIIQIILIFVVDHL